MSDKKDKPEEKKTLTEETPEEEYLVKYNSGPTTSKTANGHIYNVNVFIGQAPIPPYKP